ncbi:MAG TPA: MBL fold metallo-hydrolase [Pseudomonadales bacterium]|nr:MBL fold metallo-hydrolase [Pseudomonadales bacterium]
MDLERLDDYQSWRICCGGQRLIIDPWLVDDIEIGGGGRWLRRQHQAPVALRPRSIDRSRDIIVLTSAFSDHAHRPTLKSVDKGVRVVGAASAVKLARSLGFRSTITLSPGQRIVLDGRAALTAIRPRFPYGMGSIGLLIESLDDGVRTYFEAHVAPERHPALEPGVDVIIAPVERVRLAGVQLAMDVDQCVDLARRLKARWLLATGTAPASNLGLIPQHLLRVDGDLETFEAVTRLHLGDGRGRLLAPGEVLHVTPRRRRARPAA